jgi:SAM-dependent methyltransferase
LTAANKTYTEAVTRGDYDVYRGNLFGKYDNVRICWEDQLTRMVIRPFLSEIVSRKQKAHEKIRIIDLGSGTGQGYELLTRINNHDLDLGLHHNRVLTENEIGSYVGLDLNQTMVEKGNEIYAEKPHVQFTQADLTKGLAIIKEHTPPFDIYFSSYGSLSHLNTKHLKQLLIDICEHSRNESLIVLDLLGRHSIEWPDYWTARTEAEKFRDYSMSYLYPGVERKRTEHFPLRFWTGAEIEALVEELCRETKVTIDILKKFDRSIIVGRHTDTKEYNPAMKPIRRTVNCLYEDYMRTDLSKLILDRTMFPKHPEPQISSFFDQLTTSWNTLVEFCQQRFEKNVSLITLKGWATFPPPLQFALMTVDRMIDETQWMWSGDPRANIIEPQLGYALRSLEFNLQQGLGCGHGLLVILKIISPREIKGVK